jgi:hypothetical protein
LLFQSLLGAFGSGTGPSASPLDAFGNIICTHEGAAQLPAGDPHQQHMPACCVLSCSMVSSAYAPPPDVGRLAASLSSEAVALWSPRSGISTSPAAARRRILARLQRWPSYIRWPTEPFAGVLIQQSKLFAAGQRRDLSIIHGAIMFHSIRARFGRRNPFFAVSRNASG